MQPVLRIADEDECLHYKCQWQHRSERQRDEKAFSIEISGDPEVL